MTIEAQLTKVRRFSARWKQLRYLRDAREARAVELRNAQRECDSPYWERTRGAAYYVRQARRLGVDVRIDRAWRREMGYPNGGRW